VNKKNEEEEDSLEKLLEEENKQENEKNEQNEKQNKEEERNLNEENKEQLQTEEITEQELEDEEVDVPVLSQASGTIMTLRLANACTIETHPYTLGSQPLLNKILENGESKQFAPNSVIRWRKNENGEIQSNARLVKWSDQTWQLLIGDESYDLHTTKEKHDYLFARQPSGVYQSQATINSRFVVKPPVQSQQRKERKIKLVDPNVNPEKLKEDLEKAEEAKIKANSSLEMRKAKKRKQGPELSAGFLEGEERENEEHSGGEPEEGDITAIKAQFGVGKKKKKKTSNNE